MLTFFGGRSIQVAWGSVFGRWPCFCSSRPQPCPSLTCVPITNLNQRTLFGSNAVGRVSTLSRTIDTFLILLYFLPSENPYVTSLVFCFFTILQRASVSSLLPRTTWNWLLPSSTQLGHWAPGLSIIRSWAFWERATLNSGPDVTLLLADDKLVVSAISNQAEGCSFPRVSCWGSWVAGGLPGSGYHATSVNVTPPRHVMNNRGTLHRIPVLIGKLGYHLAGLDIAVCQYWSSRT